MEFQDKSLRCVVQRPSCDARSQGNHKTWAGIGMYCARCTRDPICRVTISFVDGVGRRPCAADAVEFGG